MRAGWKPCVARGSDPTIQLLPPRRHQPLSMDNGTRGPGAPSLATTRSPRGHRRLFALLALACACDVDFEATTHVEPDGAVTRVSRFVERGTSELRRFDLPPGGSWQEREVTVLRAGKQRKETERIYTVTRRFSPGEPIPADYLLRSGDDGSFVSNRIQVRVRDLGLVRLFDFEETYFRDDSRERLARLRELAVQLDSIWLDFFPSEFEKEWPGYTREVIERAARSTGGPFSRLAGVSGSTDGLAEAIDEYEHDLCRALEGDRDASVVRIEACVEAMDAADEPVLPEPDLAELDANEFFEALIAPFDWTTDYSYQSVVSLPGSLLSASTRARRGEAIAWDFDPQGAAEPMRARSILFIHERIAAAAGLALIGVALMARRSRRRAASRSVAT